MPENSKGSPCAARHLNHVCIAVIDIEATLDFYMLDAGQGDGLLVHCPDGKIIVIDAGNAHPVNHGELTLEPLLNQLGIDTINCLVISHADADHIGGIPHLMEHFNIELMIEGTTRKYLQI